MYQMFTTLTLPSASRRTHTLCISSFFLSTFAGVVFLAVLFGVLAADFFTAAFFAAAFFAALRHFARKTLRCLPLSPCLFAFAEQAREAAERFLLTVDFLTAFFDGVVFVTLTVLADFAGAFWASDGPAPKAKMAMAAIKAVFR